MKQGIGMKTITVNASKTYDVTIGSGFLAEAGVMIREKVGGQTAALVSDDKVAALYGEILINSLEKAGYRVVKYIFPHGETSKTPETFLSLVNFLASEKLNRTDVVIALGGGVTGDIAGFTAASYKRGIRFVQIPTTLLAAVDSSVGGKTGVNLDAGKNLLGAFYQPDLVLCDVALLSTLSPEVYKDGCAEVIKYGIIADRELLDLDLGTGTLLRLSEKAKQCTCPPASDVIYRCVKIKRDIVSEDEFEHGSRKLLNFGHTVGHAVEVLSGYEISHGFAVSIGMAVETRAAMNMGLCDSECLQDVLGILKLYELPYETTFNAKALADVCLYDKKRDGDSITMIFPEKTGCCIPKEIPVNEVEAVIKSGLGD